MQLIVAPKYEDIKYKSIFLGGGISNCPDWQSEAVNHFSSVEDITIINPRRENFNINIEDDSIIQIVWEFNYLRKSDVVLFWFPKETLCPITLYELGATLERYSFDKKQRIVIGCHPDYARKFDILIQTRLKKYESEIHTNLTSMLNSI